jgi:chromosome segregation ATPase
LQQTFCHRTDPYPATEFARRWREVLAEQRQQLERLAQMRSSRELIPFLASESTCGPSEKWNGILDEYQSLTGSVHETGEALTKLTHEIDELKEQRRSLESGIAGREQHSGELHKKIMGDDALPDSERETLTAQRKEVQQQIVDLRSEIGTVETLRKERGAQANRLRLDRNYLAHRDRLREIELEAERQRLRLVRNGLLVQGLEVADRRPCAWWFPVVDPSGKWLQEVSRTADMYFEEW